VQVKGNGLDLESRSIRRSCHQSTLKPRGTVTMSRNFLAIFAASAIALGVSASASFAQSFSTGARSSDGNALRMIMVDQSQLNTNQREAFQRFLQTANLPPTKIGKQCQFYGRPQVWCLILDPPVAERVFQQLKPQSFGSAAEIKPIRRFRGVEGGG
jgi:hypothetical protein